MSSGPITYKGETLPISEWAKRFNMKQASIRTRLDYGWSMEKIESTPIRFKRPNGQALNPLNWKEKLKW